MSKQKGLFDLRRSISTNRETWEKFEVFCRENTGLTPSFVILSMMEVAMDQSRLAPIMERMIREGVQEKMKGITADADKARKEIVKKIKAGK